MSSSIQVVDNFLPDDIFHPFSLVCMTNQIYVPGDFSGFRSEADGSIDTFGEHLTPVEEKSFAEVVFQCMLYAKSPSHSRVHDIYLCYPLFFKKLEEYLNVKRWWSMRINCTVGQVKQHIGKYHVDFDKDLLANHDQTTTSILSLIHI